MKSQSSSHFDRRLYSKRRHYPFSGQIELTYRCNLNCIHCYCKGSQDRDRELTTDEWKKILDEIHKEGCIWLVLTGGEPLIREDFLEIYAYAKERGFIITIFTSAQAFTDEIIDYLAKSPPYAMEITLNGVTKDTYESITQVQGSFSNVMKNIEILTEKKCPLIFKTNCFKQNIHEIGRIKQWVEELLGRPSKNTHSFKYDPMIYPRLNGDKEPCKYRPSCQELLEARKEDPDIWKEYQRGLHSDFPDLGREKSFLYRCDAWMNQFFIDPFGQLKFCQFSYKFSIDLKTTPFKRGFYQMFPQLLKERFKTDSKCQDCTLRPICYHCPARAFLETGDQEAPVEYYCQLAKATAEQMKIRH